MLDTLLTTVFASTFIFASSVSPVQNAVPTKTFTQMVPVRQYVSYQTGVNESLKAISQRYYGSDAYWQNIWNDNPEIINPDVLESGVYLNLKADKPEKTSPLNSVLLTLQKEKEAKEKKAAEAMRIAKEKELRLAQEALTKPTEAPIPTQQPVVAPQAGGISEEALNYLGSCEAGMDPTKNTGNGYYGAFQFSYGTWKSMNTGYERADLAPLEVQKAAVRQLLNRSSIYTQFPGCAAKMRGAGLI